ncbi:MAG TPA: type IV secretion protein Rhs, partial [Escherichia coli]|nr:type IV secretion protein Rhs [Escherichia coli]
MSGKPASRQRDMMQYGGRPVQGSAGVRLFCRIHIFSSPRGW